MSSPVVLVDLDRGAPPNAVAGSLPLVIVGITSEATSRAATSLPDVVVHHDDPLLETIVTNASRHPIAATSLVVLLRSIHQLDVDHGLAAESALYSVLQSGPEFRAWRAGNDHNAAAADTEPAALAEREDDELRIILNRPRRHNAFSRSMRDALSELLQLAAADETITSITITGRGPSFCSGGDLAEFGSFDDPATAHRTRLTRSPARLMNRIAARTHVRLHGSCLGAGIELPAFAARVTAHVDTRLGLPEISLGLIPGAGGTVSITRRIGRQRTAHLALSGQSIDASTALRWGLVDGID